MYCGRPGVWRSCEEPLAPAFAPSLPNGSLELIVSAGSGHIIVAEGFDIPAGEVAEEMSCKCFGSRDILDFRLDPGAIGKARASQAFVFV